MSPNKEILARIAPCFDLDGTLAPLAKWLRILGFDAEAPCSAPRPGRIFVTARESGARVDTIVVKGSNPLEQLEEVLAAAEALARPELLFTRCLRCNVVLRQATVEAVVGRVPGAVRDSFTEFNECPACGKVYWEGSHHERMKARLGKAGLLPRP